jgi:hypothetical protein
MTSTVHTLRHFAAQLRTHAQILREADEIDRLQEARHWEHLAAELLLLADQLTEIQTHQKLDPPHALT